MLVLTNFDSRDHSMGNHSVPCLQFFNWFDIDMHRRGPDRNGILMEFCPGHHVICTIHHQHRIVPLCAAVLSKARLVGITRCTRYIFHTYHTG